MKMKSNIVVQDAQLPHYEWWVSYGLDNISDIAALKTDQIGTLQAKYVGNGCVFEKFTPDKY